MSVGVLAAFGTRLLLVMLFLPFSALDKVFNFGGAVAQARKIAPGRLADGLILVGLAVETFGSLAILSGVADRLAGFVLAGYCGVTALLWKQFWVPGDFWQGSESQGRQLFWDFMKNLALAGGFLLLTFGVTAESATLFFQHPLSSTHPYGATAGR